MPRFERLGMIARWKPVHRGHAAVLRGLAGSTEHLTLGIGSSNGYDPRNPFTAGETEAMIRLVLPEHHDLRIYPIPDLFDGPRWKKMVTETFGALDAFVTANGWVARLLQDDYEILHPATFVPESERAPIDGTMVREAMARGDDWVSLVPPEVATYLRDEGLDERFRQEFGLYTLASLTT